MSSTIYLKEHVDHSLAIPSYITVPVEQILTDSSYATDDNSIATIIESQIDYASPIDPYTKLHSVMQNEFYRDFSNALISEFKNLTNYTNELKTLFDIDYFDGDQTSFLNKIQNISSLLKFELPLKFLPYTNIETGYNNVLFSSSIYTTSLVNNSSNYQIIDDGVTSSSVWGSDQYVNYSVTIYSSTGTVQTSIISSNGPNTLNLLFPWVYTIGATYTYSVFGSLSNLTNQNNFLRNIVKSIWLMRKWAGSRYGYLLPITLLHRIGSVHIGGVFNTSILQETTDKIFKFQNLDKFLYLLPGNTNSIFPNTGNVQGIQSVSLVPPTTLYWDTNITWDSTDALGSKNIWDKSVPATATTNILLLEMALDRLLTYPNSIKSNPSECLLESVFLSSATTLLANVQKASDEVIVGAQLTLVTNKDGSFNSLSLGLYSHPNIKAKFQVTGGLWSDAILSSISYMKIGTGGYVKDGLAGLPIQKTGVVTTDTGTSTSSIVTGYTLQDTTKNWTINYWKNAYISITGGTGLEATNTIISNTNNTITVSVPWTVDTTSIYYIQKTIDGNVFVDTTKSEVYSDVNKVQLSDLQSPVLQSPIVTSQELKVVGGYDLISTIFHQRQISELKVPTTITVNSFAPTVALSPQTIQGLKNITPGTLNININIDNYILPPIITTNVANTSILSINLDTLQGTIFEYTFQGIGVCPANSTVTFTIQRFTQSVTYTYSVGGLTAIQILTAITNKTIFPLVFPSIYLGQTDIQDWSLSTSGTTLYMVPAFNEIHQQINIFDTLDTTTNTYNTDYSIKFLNNMIPATNDSSTSGIAITQFTRNINTPYIFSCILESITNITNGNIIVNGISLPISSTDTFTDIAIKITQTSMPNWIVSWGLVNNTDYTIYLEMTHPYVTLQQMYVFGGYTTDTQYEIISSDTYIPTTQLNIFNLIPISGKTNSFGNPVFIDVNYTNGIATLYLQYNENGPLLNSKSASSGIVTHETFTVDNIYSISSYDRDLPISEIGLFNSSDQLLAYATFPSIIINPSKYHLSINLLIKK